MLQFVFQPFEAKPLDLQILCNLRKKFSIYLKIAANYGIFCSMKAKWPRVKFYGLESLKSFHTYQSHLLNFFGIFLFSNSGFRVIDCNSGKF